jgi:hypothetical protein
MLLRAASATTSLTPVLIVLVLGLLVALVGHIVRLSWLVLVGILAIGADVILFWVVLRPGAG